MVRIQLPEYFVGKSLPVVAVLEEGIAHAERDGTRAETRFRLSPKRTSPFKSVWAPVQSTTGSRGVRISSSNGSNAGQTTFRGKVELYWLPTPFACFHFPSLASPCATRCRTSSNAGSSAMHGFWPVEDRATGKLTKATLLVSSCSNFN